MARQILDSPFLYGFHDRGGQQIMLDLGVPGWVLVTEAIGSDPNATDGRNYRDLSEHGLGVIVRLNAGYLTTGTLPAESAYANFARRCANFVRASAGAKIWIIGNEPNHPIEWPGGDWDFNADPPRPRSEDRRGEPITPERYARCYRAVRDAIKAVPGHADDQVLVAATAPWNALLTYPGNPTGDWIQYFSDTLTLIGAGNCDGITLHTYSHGTTPDLIRSEVRMGGSFTHRRFHFRAYQDFLAAIPPNMRGLPIYITEANQGDVEWRNENTGWVREAYQEINAWNRANTQQIRALILYRWEQVLRDRWGIQGKGGVIEDFRQAVSQRHRWGVADPLAALRQRTADLEQSLAALGAASKAVAQAATGLAAAKRSADGLAAKAAQAQLTALPARLNALAAEVKALEDQVGAAPPQPDSAVPQPELQDLRGKLPTGTGAAYPTRGLGDIRRVVIHHTVTRGDITAERLAQAQVNQGKPGITYHFLVNENGAITWTQPLETAAAQATRAEINADSIGVALAGSFSATPPGAAQLNGAAALVAWLLSRFRLTTADVYGRHDLENVTSPGSQWWQGAKYRDSLLAQIQAIIDSYADADQVVEQLRRQISQLQAQVVDLTAKAGQVPALQTQITALQSTIKSQADQISRLQDQLRTCTGGRVARPPIIDMVDQLEKHPTLAPYTKRIKPISTIAIHHTDTRRDMTVQGLAHYHVTGVRKYPDGTIAKAQWPGIAYHYVIAPDGVIYQGQRDETRSYHVGDANDSCIAISFIGRFMNTDHNKQPQPAEDQVPTPAQLRSAAQLAAWLMQEYKIPINRILGHREIAVGSTVCPGENWKTGRKWWIPFQQAILAAQQGQSAGQLEHYLLFWSRSDGWAEADWRNAQGYIAHFRPTTGFSVDDALLARHVTIVGGDAGVSGVAEQRLHEAGIDVHRLSGRDEAHTKALLDELVAKNTPWPGAPALAQPARDISADAAGPGLAGIEGAEIESVDAWTVPDDAPALPEPVAASDEGYLRIIAPLPAGAAPQTASTPGSEEQ